MAMSPARPNKPYFVTQIRCGMLISSFPLLGKVDGI